MSICEKSWNKIRLYRDVIIFPNSIILVIEKLTTIILRISEKLYTIFFIKFVKSK